MFTQSKSERGRGKLKHRSEYNGLTGDFPAQKCLETCPLCFFSKREVVNNIHIVEILKVWPITVLFLNAISITNMLIYNNLLILMIHSKVKKSRYLDLQAIVFITSGLCILQSAFPIGISAFAKILYHSAKRVAGQGQ